MGLLILLWGGLWAASHIHINAHHKLRLICVVILCSLGEHIIVETTWVHYSDKPTQEGLYNEPKWISHLKQEIGDGSVIFYSSARDKNYLHTNHFSSFGLRQAEGYETVQPKRLHSLKNSLTHPELAAKAGISHILVNPRHDLPKIKGWDLVEHNSLCILFSNPYYKGRYFVTNPSTGKEEVIQANWETYNKIDLTVPPGYSSLKVLKVIPLAGLLKLMGSSHLI